MHTIREKVAQINTLLAADDPLPCEQINPDGKSPFVLVCEHAGRAIPRALGRLGIDPGSMDQHIAYDIGAAEVARALAQQLDAPLVLQPYSRLVIDCNRPASSPACIPECSDGVLIPGNVDLSTAARRARIDAIHTPFHQAITHLLDARASDRKGTLLVSIHSFTPRLATSLSERPWHLGLLYNRDPSLSKLIFAAFESLKSGHLAEYNVPYHVDDDDDFTIPVHGERRGLRHALVEVRNDQIVTEAGQEYWAGVLGEALEKVTAAQEFATWRN